MQNLLQCHRILPHLAPYTADSFHLPSSDPYTPVPVVPSLYSIGHFSLHLKPIKPPDAQLPATDNFKAPPHTQYPPLQHSDPPSPPQPQIMITAPDREQSITPDIILPGVPPQNSPQDTCGTDLHVSSGDSPKIESEETINPPNTPSNTPTDPESGQSLNNDQPVVENSQQPSEAGLASAFSQMKLGEPSPAATMELQEHLRRSAWEQGSMDFMGADAFDNIWSKIMDTVNKGPSNK